MAAAIQCIRRIVDKGRGNTGTPTILVLLNMGQGFFDKVSHEGLFKQQGRLQV